jgi:hypothetical protein
MLLGALLAGLAVLTKYSAAVVLPVMAFYAWQRGRHRHILWLAASGALIVFWCLHNWLVYGQVHMLYLFLERRSTGSIVWQQKFFGALTVLGSSCLLFVALVAESIRRRRWLILGSSVLLTAAVIWRVQVFHEGRVDWEYLFWAGAGVMAFSIPVLAALRRKGYSQDSLFLVIWTSGVVWFGIFMVPFQAVRHLLPALPPLILLSFQFLRGAKRQWARTERSVLVFLLLVQVGIAAIVHLADYEYADSYRDFAQKFRERGNPSWYVGHWGWKFYADRSGFRPLHRDGPYPSQGELLLWPSNVHIGRVFQNDRGLRDRLELVSSELYDGVIPVRTMDRDSGAGFYSIGFGELPFRFFPKSPLEEMRVYRVKEDFQPSP